MIKYCAFALLLSSSAAEEIRDTDKDRSSDSCTRRSWYIPGFDPLRNNSWSALDCSLECSSHSDCREWNWKYKLGCYLKTDANPNPTRARFDGFIEGDKGCTPAGRRLDNGPSKDDVCMTAFWYLPDFVPAKNSSWTATDCSDECSLNDECTAWYWRQGESCYLKSEKNPSPIRRSTDPGFLVGSKSCKPLTEGFVTSGWGNVSFLQEKSQSLRNNPRDSYYPVDESTSGSPFLFSEFAPNLTIVPDKPPKGQRCSGRNYGDRRCCSPENPCDEGEGDCDGPGDGGQHDGHAGCKGDLVCGSNNCKKFGSYFHEKDDCCEKSSSSSLSSSESSSSSLSSSESSSSSLSSSESQTQSEVVSIAGSSNIPLLPQPGQRCRGRNYGERRCCNPESPCDEGEGDCDGPGDGGGHDGHAGCKGDLVCGSNNCKKFGTYYHEKDDCCQKPSPISLSSSSVPSPISLSSSSVPQQQFDLGSLTGPSNIPSEPPQGQRCSGRNFGSRGCCSPESPCDEGEGDCEQNGDCSVGLVCGNNNCKQFGTYYHKKDDCCERPSSSSSSSGASKIPSKPPPGQRCSGRNFGERGCCSDANPCNEGEGDCESHSDCKEGLVCGDNNCKQFGTYFHKKDDCCERPSSSSSDGLSSKRPSSSSSNGLSSKIPLQPPPGQRCSGRNFGERGCCSQENPCNEGEGDCEDNSDCGEGLTCGNNNCKKFGTYYHEKDDCCEKPSSSGSPPNGLVSSSGSSKIPSIPPQGQRCSGRNYGERRCCTPDNPCNEGEGDCDGPGDGGQHDGHAGCKGSLVCGSNNCKKFGTYYHEKDDCCENPSSSLNIDDVWSSWGAWSKCSQISGGGKISRDRSCAGKSCRRTQQSQERYFSSPDCRAFSNIPADFKPVFDSSSGSSPTSLKIPQEPPSGQRCRGRNYGERRCCTPENPCNEGEGDCDGPGDGGQHDGHAGCKGSLVCGSNNCKKFGTYYHEKDDCCENPFSPPPNGLNPSPGLTVPAEPPVGQRCRGRNYGERRCCTPENPCEEGEGDCDGPGDGGQHDGHAGCKGDLVCGSNNCKKFGTYYHEKDDCCEKSSSSLSGGSIELIAGWSSWGPWTQCSKRCDLGKRSRERTCSGPSCTHKQQSQERFCNKFACEEGPSPKRGPKNFNLKKK